MPACPSCGYENAEDALCCNLCQAVLRREKSSSSLDSPEAVKALLKQVLELGKDAAKKGDAKALREELPALCSRLFLEAPTELCRSLVLEPTAAAWLQLVAPSILGAERHALLKALLRRMCDAAQARRFAEAFALLQEADKAVGKHGRMELLILGLGLKRAMEKSEQAPPPKPIAAPAQPSRAAPLKKGDVLARDFEIHGTLGEGGFGIVYLAYHRPSDTAMALKTFRDELFHDAAVRALFLKEAQALVDLEAHPNLLRAYMVREIEGRLFIALEYVAPDADGVNTLEGCLRRRPPDPATALRWAVQFCHGMEFAQAKGLRCHRDIKPANIMLGGGGRLMISDFGLAHVLRQTGAASADPQRGMAMGTPPYMPPEQFQGSERCDFRSDVYSFGVVLYQLASGGKLPFLGRAWDDFQRLHASAAPPPLDAPLWPVVARCLAKSPLDRYQSFRLLREDLEALLNRTTGEAAAAPELSQREWYEWDTKGSSLMALGRLQEALACYEKSLALAESAQAWNNKAVVLMRLGRASEALACFDKALALEDSPRTWSTKAAAFIGLGRLAEALAAAEAAIARDPRSYGGWVNKATILGMLGRHEESLAAIDRALAVDASSSEGWQSKGAALQALGRLEEAAAAADKALSINPGCAAAWANKGYALSGLGRHEEALGCFRESVKHDPGLLAGWAGAREACKALGRAEEASAALDKELELDPAHGPSWLDKGKEHAEAKSWDAALACMDKAVRFEPEWPFAWVNRGLALEMLGRLEEAQADYGRAFALKPDYAGAALSRASVLRRLGRHDEALACFKAACTAGPLPASKSVFAAWFGRAEALHRLGRFAEAEACYAKAADSAPENVRAVVADARAACAAGRPPIT